MMATVPHVTSGSGLRKFQSDGFLSDGVYKTNKSTGAKVYKWSLRREHSFSFWVPYNNIPG
jgi:hypothetical protein